MNKLTNERINELASKPGVRAIAVKNFLGSLGRQTREQAEANLEQDARLYRWNAATIAAIRLGIRETHAAPKKPRVRRVRRTPSVDRAWGREEAMQLGMGLGVEAYNDAMGYGAGESDPDE